MDANYPCGLIPNYIRDEVPWSDRNWRIWGRGGSPALEALVCDVHDSYWEGLNEGLGVRGAADSRALLAMGNRQ